MVYVPGLKGSLRAEIAAATRQLGFLAVELDGQLESLLREVDAGNPVFVLRNLGYDAYPIWHYEILVGYDLERQELILRSGLDRRITRSFGIFEQTWQRADHWALVVTSPDAIPASASPESFLAAVVDMEQVGQAALARAGYATAIERWPDNVLARLGLGNASYALGDYAAAASAYRSALEYEPGNAALWNNLAYALARLGDRQGSIDAIGKALELDPDNPEYLDSRTELENGSL